MTWRGVGEGEGLRTDVAQTKKILSQTVFEKFLAN
jgi:hypothetical protein